MKLTFKAKDGSTVTAEADDADMTVAEVQQGAQDFIMLRYKPGTLKVTVPEGTEHHMRFEGNP